MPDYRISDNERQQAMDDLGTHFAAGRLTMDEYEQRISLAAEATMKSDIFPIFDDLPSSLSVSSTSAIEPSYTVGEINSLRSRGRNMRLGILGLSSVLALGAGIVTEQAIIPFIIIPTIFILLYIMKVGPSSWYTPSPARLERERQREVRMLKANQMREIEIANAQQLAQQKALRQQKQAELTNTAIDITNQTLKRFKGRR